MRMCIWLIMTKVVSLSKKAYQTLKDQKRPNESFSDVVLRISNTKQTKSIQQFAGTWNGNDIDEIYNQIQNTREKTITREIKI
jgi:predicted CopG family antitoxin